MRLGFNYPHSYNRFGDDFGPNFWVSPSDWSKNNALEKKGDLAAIPPAPLLDHVDRNLANLKRMGFSVVRWFVLANGASYFPAPTHVLRPDPYLPRAGRYKWDLNFDPPNPIDKRFRRDFEELLKRFQQAQLQLIPVLISFEYGSRELFGPNVKDPVTGVVLPERGYNCGRADVIRDPVKRKVFLDTMLKELLDVSRPYNRPYNNQDVIYAWEVINEPIWLCQDVGALSYPAWVPGIHIPEVSDTEMTSFLNDALDRIKAAGFESTVGHRYYSDLVRFPTGSIPQFHYYAERPWYQVASGYPADPGKIGGADLFARSPNRTKPIVGEFDSDANRFGDPWSQDLSTADSTLERLRLLEREGCDLALIWPDLGGAKSGRVDKATLEAEHAGIDTNDVIKLLPQTRQAVVNFTGGILPPASE